MEVHGIRGKTVKARIPRRISVITEPISDFQRNAYPYRETERHGDKHIYSRGVFPRESSVSVVGGAKRGERINRASHRTPRGGETQRRCHVVGVMRPAHTEDEKISRRRFHSAAAFLYPLFSAYTIARLIMDR